MRPPRRAGSASLFLLAALTMIGCGHSPATTFLALDPAPPAATAGTYRGPIVRVPFLHVPVTLDRPEFVQQVAGTVEVSDFNRWAAPLGLLARNTLIQDLQTRLPAGSVLPPDSGAAVPEVRIEVTVLAVRAENGEAVMDLSYRLVRAPVGKGPAPVSPPEPLSLRAAIADDTPAAQARAWSALLGQLADRIATQLAAAG